MAVIEELVYQIPHMKTFEELEKEWPNILNSLVRQPHPRFPWLWCSPEDLKRTVATITPDGGGVELLVRYSLRDDGDVPAIVGA